MFTAGEDHSGNPEENDVIAGNKHIGRIEIFQILSLFRPAKGLEGPQSRTEPGIQHIGIPLDLCAATLFTLAGIFARYGNVSAVLTGPSRDLMTPPKLTGNTPVTNIFHPVQIGLGETVRHELCLAVTNYANCFLSQRLHFHKPLCRNDRLNIVMAAVASANIMGVILDLYQIALRLQISNDRLSGFIAIQPLVFSAIAVNNTVIVQYPDHFQIMTQTDFKVIGVVGRCHLHAASTEFHFCIVIGYHRNFLIHKGQDHSLTDNCFVTVIIGVDADTGITKHSFRTGSCNNHFPAAVSERIADMPQVTGLIHVLDLCIRKSGHTVRTPVDNTASLVDQALLVKRHKHFTDSAGTALVHGKASTFPVTGCAQLFLLLNDPVAVLMFPVPNPFQEFFTTQIIAGQSFLAQFFFYLDLCSNACVVNTGHPQGIITLHTLKTDQGILQCCVHCVTHMQLTGNIGRGHNNCKGLCVLVACRTEISVFFPHFIDLIFYLLGLIHFWKFSCHSKYSFNKKHPEPKAQGEKIPRYHLNSLKRALKRCNGRTHTSLLSFRKSTPGRQFTLSHTCLHQTHALFNDERQKLPIHVL